jgi:spermidine synthase
MNISYPGILALFFFSGASALAYETLWQRQMLLVFGASAPATTAVLTSFFCGIAFGSLIGGRILRRHANALKFYAAVELWIGVCALLLPVFLRGIEDLYVLLSRSWAAEIQDTVPSFLTRFSMAMVVVLPATLGMGATIPAMNRILDEMKKRSIGVNIGLAYGINTLGAVVGGIMTGFLLIKSVGVKNSMYVAFCMNAVVFLGALYFSRSFSFTTPAHAARKLPKTFFWLMVIYFGSGFLALGYEVLWLRILGILATNGVYTFVLALAVYLLGFSLGSLFLFKELAQRLSALKIFFIANFGVGASALACISAAYFWPPIIKRQMLRIVEDGALSLGHLTLFEAVYAFSLMFVPAIFMGLAYPAVCQKLIEDRENIAEQSGSIYFIGNLGAMFGIFCTGLLIVPALGLNGTLAVFCAASILFALLTVLVYRETFPAKPIPGYASSGIVLALSALYIVNAPPILRYGEAHYDRETGMWREGSMGPGAKATTILRYKAGASGTIIVKEERLSGETDSYRRLYVDDQPVASTIPAAVIDAKMLAHIPLFLHSNPSNALTVGFGSGGTSYSMRAHGVDTYAVEIEAEVLRGAKYFLEQNHNVMESAGFYLILNDARDHLHTTRRKYDVISTDVTNLQYKQNASLYSREYFRLMKRSLAENGIACAWIPIKAIYEDELRILMRTFLDVFPYASLWFMDHAETSFGILIGTPGPVRFDLRRFKKAYAVPEVRRDLMGVGVADPHQIMSFMYLDHEGYREYVGAGPLHTDDRPTLEFSSPVSFYLGGASLYPMTEKWNSLRAGSFLPLLQDATEREKEVYARDEKFYRKLASVNRRIFLKKDFAGDRISDLEDQVRLLDEALELRPHDPRALRIKEEFEAALKMLRMRPPRG